MGAGSVKAACAAAIAGGREVGVDYEGEYRVDWTNSLGEIEAAKQAGTPIENPIIHSTFGYAAQVVVLAEDGTVENVVAAHDVGKAVNPMLCEGQIEGAVHMGLGYALTEGFPCDETGFPTNTTLKSLAIIRPKDMPPVEVILVEAAQPDSPYGIKGVGEIGLVPTAGAVAAALRAHGGTWHNELPMLNETNRERASAWVDMFRVLGAAVGCPLFLGWYADMSGVMGTTAGMVCAHHHLYSSLARGMPAPPKDPANFLEILENVWWRLDTALDLEMIEWSAKLGALDALEAGTTAIFDHHESPNAIEGSLSVIADAVNEVGLRINTTYGITDRHGPDGAKRGLAENDRYLTELAAGSEVLGHRRKGMVGVHAAFTCSDDSLAAAAELAAKHGVGVHIHVAEGPDDIGVEERIRDLTRDDWLLIHGVHLPTDHGLRGTIVHNPRSNMNNSVGYADPARFVNLTALGTDGIGADMLAEFQLAYFKQRDQDVTATPDAAWSWLEHGRDLFPEAREDEVTWSYSTIEPWHVAFTPTIRAIDVDIAGEAVLRDGEATRVDAAQIRAKAAEQAVRLHRGVEV